MGGPLSEGCSTTGPQELDAVGQCDINVKKPGGRDTPGFFAMGLGEPMSTCPRAAGVGTTSGSLLYRNTGYVLRLFVFPSATFLEDDFPLGLALCSCWLSL